MTRGISHSKHVDHNSHRLWLYAHTQEPHRSACMSQNKTASFHARLPGYIRHTLHTCVMDGQLT